MYRGRQFWRIQQIQAYFEGGQRKSETLELRQGLFRFAKTEEPGPYVFATGTGEYGTCVNLFDASESHVAPSSSGGSDGEEVQAEEASIFHRDLWPLLVMLGLVLWVVEWATYHRRVTE